ncbi:hypothetical protein N7474_001558 [Penicillium riverlandense]|uniref:uncharacterized protein n=1 Tax=Penicillium riverlandense TaxID=1903569 RepID=UPI0025465977|nr:uncharacterized protein N7474_001558 [Penicillium riverlandense]KAJ5833247.1 hypothetical protein N7474_001558 [Penicillium riverlandense]
MWGQSRAVMQHISDAVIMRSERSLDLLQGILVFLGYYHYYCLARGQFNNLTHLATSMIGDMGLDRRTRPREMAPYPAMDPEEPRAMTNEERRVLVGAWYMGSNAALSFNKLESPRYTKHHDQCLNELKDAAEYETDELLVQLIRIQHLTERIFQFNHRDQFTVESIGVALQETTAAVHLSAFQAELDRLENSLPMKLKANYLLLSHYNTAQLRLFGPLLSDIGPSSVTTPASVPLSLMHTEGFDRYRAATSTLRTWVNNWLAIPVCYYFYMPQPCYGHLIYAITMLARQARLSLLVNAQPKCASSISSNISADTAQPATKNSEAETTENMVLNALESFASRFAAARVEIGAAHGREWENNRLDLIAKTLRVKKARIEKWSNVLLAAMNGGCSGDGFAPGKGWPAFGSVEGQESNTGAREDAAGWMFEQIDRSLLDDNYQESWLWGSDPLDILSTDQRNLEEGLGSGIATCLPNTGFEYQ